MDIRRGGGDRVGHRRPANSRPRAFGSGWFSSSWATSKQLPDASVQSLIRRALVSPFDSLLSISRTLPPHVLISLIYRVAVLHLAARIVPLIRKATMGDDTTNGAPGFWDGRSLGEEPANMRITTVVLSYRRAILIAVYTHLLREYFLNVN
jgi:hypothetical protein